MPGELSVHPAHLNGAFAGGCAAGEAGGAPGRSAYDLRTSDRVFAVTRYVPADAMPERAAKPAAIAPAASNDPPIVFNCASSPAKRRRRKLPAAALIGTLRCCVSSPELRCGSRWWYLYLFGKLLYRLLQLCRCSRSGRIFHPLL